MKVTIEGVDRSSSYTPEELAAIELVMQADSVQGDGLGTCPVPTLSPSDEAASGQSALFEVGAVTMLDGFIGATNRGRNGAIGGRQTLNYTIVDQNAMLKGHRAVRWVRPAELDRDRILAAIDTFLGYLSLDVSMVLNTNNQTIPAKTYMTEDLFGELQTDCGDPTGKGMFIENRRFHWHLQTEGDTAGLTVVSSGEDRATSFALDSATPPIRSKDGMDLITDVLARNPTTGVSYTATDSTAQALHDASGIRHQRLIEQDGATLAQLTQLANRMLATYKGERVTYEGVIGPLSPGQVALIPPGSLITVTDPVWGLTGSVQRIAGLRLAYRHPDTFMATLQLGYVPRLKVKPIKDTSSSSAGTGSDTGGTGGGGGCSDCPAFQDGCPFSTFDDMNRTNASAWGTTSSASGTWAGSKVSDASPGSLIVLVDSMVPTHGTMKLTHPSGTWNGAAEERIVGPGPWSTGDWTIRTSVKVLNTNVVFWEVNVGDAGVSWGRGSGGQLEVSNDGLSTLVALPPATFDGMGFISIELRKTGSTVTAIVSGLQVDQSNFSTPTGLDDMVFVLGGLAAVSGGAEIEFGPINIADCASAPSPGQEFTDTQVGDGSTTVFTVRYAIGSLEAVLVDGVDVTSDVTFSSATYTFGHAPIAGATIVVRFKAA